MNNVTLSIEQSTIVFSGQLFSSYQEAADIVKAYFSTDASTLVGPKGPSVAVTVSTGLTQAEFVGGITLCQSLQSLIENQAVSTADYSSSSQNLLHGSTPANAVLSQNVESLGSRLVSLAGTLIAQNKVASGVLSNYSSAQLSAILAAITGDPVVIGCNTAKTKFSSGVNLVQQFVNFMGNQSVAQGDYLSVIQSWVQGV